MQQIPYRSVEDVGIRMPHAFQAAKEPLDEALLTRVALCAGMTRASGIVAAAQELSTAPSNKLNTIIYLLKSLIFARFQQTIDEVVTTAPRLGCKSGCAYCCHVRVEATIPEAIMVFAHLIDPADPRRQRVLDNADRLQSMDEAGRMFARVPCPMLIDDKCSIYEDRPLMCRAMMAADAAKCHAAFHSTSSENEIAIEQFVDAQFSACGDQAAMRGILKDMGLQYDVVELTRAVAAMIRDPAIVERWLAGEQAFETERAPDDVATGEDGARSAKD